ncbi:hypothetical protein Cgig2_021724 [Carnegiea gigantea]|uniref:Uncharacterized protein n=1 Tax=Carnegiea gigantea TaxID=171969 RepID=A0A9Q1GMA2_9CARY|nr:hypothetical protein Cgig2_021724 [Carnegiea gigantea]
MNLKLHSGTQCLTSIIHHTTSPPHLLRPSFSRVQDLHVGLLPLPSNLLVLLVVVSLELATLPSSQRYPHLNATPSRINYFLALLSIFRRPYSDDQGFQFWSHISHFSLCPSLPHPSALATSSFLASTTHISTPSPPALVLQSLGPSRRPPPSSQQPFGHARCGFARTSHATLISALPLHGSTIFRHFCPFFRRLYSDNQHPPYHISTPSPPALVLQSPGPSRQPPPSSQQPFGLARCGFARTSQATLISALPSSQRYPSRINYFLALLSIFRGSYSDKQHPPHHISTPSPPALVLQSPGPSCRPPPSSQQPFGLARCGFTRTSHATLISALPSSQRYPFTDELFSSTFVHFSAPLFRQPVLSVALSSLLFCSCNLISSSIHHTTSPPHLLRPSFPRVQDLHIGLLPLPSNLLVLLIEVSLKLATLPSSQRYPFTDRLFFGTFVHFSAPLCSQSGNLIYQSYVIILHPQPHTLSQTDMG